MGASVGIGGLIIGVSMLVVFSMAITAFDSQVATGLDAIESASVPDPSFTIDDATISQFAIHEPVFQQEIEAQVMWMVLKQQMSVQRMRRLFSPIHYHWRGN